MSGSIIRFGQINKKILLPIFLAILQMVFIIVNRYFKEEHNNLVFQMYAVSFGQMLIKFLPCILKISVNNTGENEFIGEIKQNKCKHYSLLCLLFIGNTAISAVAGFLYSKWASDKHLEYNESNLFPQKDFIIMSIEMIIMIFISIWLLKYKYYKHHIISVIIYMIFGVLSEGLIGSYTYKDNRALIVKLIRALGGAVDATYYCFQKFLMDKYYYPYWNIAFVPGVLFFIFSNITLIIVLADPLKAESGNDFVKDFYLYFKQDAGRTVGRILIYFVLHIIMCPLIILTIYYFTPNFILIVLQFSRITEHLIVIEKSQLYIISFYVIQFIALMIHLEIIELNFCGLNNHTKQNIDLRGIDDLTSEGRDSTVGLNSFDINKDYTIENQENNENPVEMREQRNDGENKN